jgi:hypothetical protein
MMILLELGRSAAKRRTLAKIGPFWQCSIRR